MDNIHSISVMVCQLKKKEHHINTKILICIHRSIGELVQRNADYLVNAISLRLRHFCENKKSPLVLKVMLQYSSKDILPLINDAIQEVGVYHYLKWLLF